jgi:hypothetical protein
LQYIICTKWNTLWVQSVVLMLFVNLSWNTCFTHKPLSCIPFRKTALKGFLFQAEWRTIAWEPLVEETGVIRLEMMRLMYTDIRYLSINKIKTITHCNSILFVTRHLGINLYLTYMYTYFIWPLRKNKKFSEEPIPYFPSIRHGPHKKRRVQQFFYCCVRIRCRGTVSTEPLPSNNRRDTHTDTQTDERDLWSTSRRWAQVPWYTYRVS